MNNQYPEFFYKYRSIDDALPIEENHSIQCLLKNEAIFSSRIGFNDIFDSKFHLSMPKPAELKTLRNNIQKNRKAEIEKWFSKGKITAEGVSQLCKFKDTFNEKVDSYLFYCLSAKSNSNLMWAHYANSHRGFCIEFKSEKLKAEKVEYKKNLPEFNLIRFLNYAYTGRDEGIADDIRDALKVKLDEWSYEEEYRFFASSTMGSASPNKLFKKIVYDFDWIESIIFGCRMKEENKKFISKNLPKRMKYKEAKYTKSGIEIRPHFSQ